MGTTSNGYPYPEPSDPVSEGANAIKALAASLPPRLVRQSSPSTGQNYTTSSIGRIYVQFPQTFADPNVNMNAWAISGDFMIVMVSYSPTYGVSASDARFRVFQVTGAPVVNTTVAMRWVAIGVIKPT